MREQRDWMDPVMQAGEMWPLGYPTCILWSSIWCLSEERPHLPPSFSYVLSWIVDSIHHQRSLLFPLRPGIEGGKLSNPRTGRALLGTLVVQEWGDVWRQPSSSLDAVQLADLIWCDRDRERWLSGTVFTRSILVSLRPRPWNFPGAYSVTVLRHVRDAKVMWWRDFCLQYLYRGK